MLKIVLLLAVAALAVYAIPGGWEDANLEDEDVLAAANHAAKGLSKQFAGKYHHKLAKLLKAEKQVVAGMNYRLDVIVGRTACEKTEVEFEDQDACDFQDEHSTYKKCQVMVYRDLKDEHKLVSTGCILANREDLE